MKVLVHGDWIDTLLVGEMGTAANATVRRLERAGTAPLEFEPVPARLGFLVACSKDRELRSQIISLGMPLGPCEVVIRPAPQRHRFVRVRFADDVRSLISLSTLRLPRAIRRLASLDEVEVAKADGVEGTRILLRAQENTWVCLRSALGTQYVEVPPLGSCQDGIQLQLPPTTRVQVVDSGLQPVAEAMVEIEVAADGPYRTPVLLGRTDSDGSLIVPEDVLGMRVFVAARGFRVWNGTCTATIRLETKPETRVELPSHLRNEAQGCLQLDVWGQRSQSTIPAELPEVTDDAIVHPDPRHIRAYTLSGGEGACEVDEQGRATWTEKPPVVRTVSVDGTAARTTTCALGMPTGGRVMWREGGADCAIETASELVPLSVLARARIEPGEHILPWSFGWAPMVFSAPGKAICRWTPSQGNARGSSAVVILHRDALHARIACKGVPGQVLRGVWLGCRVQAVGDDFSPFRRDDRGFSLVASFNALVEGGQLVLPVPRGMKVALECNDPSVAIKSGAMIDGLSEATLDLAAASALAVHGATEVLLRGPGIPETKIRRCGVLLTCTVGGLLPGEHEVTCGSATLRVSVTEEAKLHVLTVTPPASR